MNIVFASAEVSPIAKTGGLGDVCGSLPKEMARLGHDVTVFMPYYRQARQYFAENGIEPEVVMPPEWVTGGTWTAEIALLRTTLPGSDVPLILVANDHYYDREQIHGMLHGIDDFLERYAVFCRAVVMGCVQLGIHPDILHAHDWHTALLPVHLHAGLRATPAFRQTRSVYTIHNLHYQGVTGAAAFGMTGLHTRYWASDALEHFGELNPMKGGILFADQVTTVSPNYAREIQTPEYGAGLDGVLRSVSHKFTGILNGIDVEEWDPATDPHLPVHYDRDDPGAKATLKRLLTKEAGLPYSAPVPLLGVVSRMVEQKGFHLLLPVLGRLLQAGAQAVILGSGDGAIEDGFRYVADHNPDRCRVWIGFNNALAHRINAASDLLLMPSLYEPCGLNQMYALRYGTLPVVRLTGGLADTVVPYDGTNGEAANGFGFAHAVSDELYLATWVAMLNRRDATLWKALQRNGMQQDFSWSSSARRYEEVYRRAAG
ncbi:MAG TPA: glycogen/starch synthase [Thermoanaerobaculia bacterium]|nr:glycogen/starch synthase [Thermoanaerobaculia bacterium]